MSEPSERKERVGAKKKERVLTCCGIEPGLRILEDC